MPPVDFKTLIDPSGKLKELHPNFQISEPIEFKVLDGGGDDFYIEGYSSKVIVDRGNDIVKPEAFKETMPVYMTNPVVCYMHRWGYDGALPIGKVVEYKIDNIGLWERIYISKTVPVIRELIREKILRGLSIGFDYEQSWLEINEENKRVILKLNKYETSVVTIPMNPETLAEQAKTKGINLKSLIIAPGGIADPGASKKEFVMPPETDELKALREKVEDTSNRVKGLTDQIAKSITVEPKLGEIIGDLVKANQESTAQFKEMIEKAYKDFFKRYDEKSAEDEKKNAKRKLFWDDPSLFSVDMQNLKGAKLRDPYEFHIKVLNKDYRGLSDNHQRIVKELQFLNDRLYTAQWFGKQYGDPGFNVKNLSLYSDYNRLKNEFLKAMDSETTGEGADWGAVGYSTRLFEKIMPALKVAGIFETIPMPLPTINFPTDMNEDTGYLIPQNLHDVADKIRAITPPTGDVTLKCKKFGARVVVSNELIEDAIVAILPRIERKLIRAISRAIETSIINGDDSGTHFDSNVSNTWDARKAYKGIRRYAKLAGTETDLGTYNAENLRSLRKPMGDYGINPEDLVHIVSLSEYINMLSLKDSNGNQVVATLQAWGPDHTFRKGTLSIFDGSEVMVSPFVQTNLNASGVYDGTTIDKTIHILVNAEGFVAGERRITKVGSKEDIETDQRITVVTSRRGFAKVVSDDLYPVSIGINVTP